MTPQQIQDLLTLLGQPGIGMGVKGLMQADDPMRAYVNLWQSGFEKARPYVDKKLDYMFKNVGPEFSAFLDKMYGR